MSDALYLAVCAAFFALCAGLVIFLGKEKDRERSVRERE